VTLTGQHLADLRRSGLSDETIAAAGFRSLSAEGVREVLGMDVGSGLAIPYPGAAYGDGSPYVRVRLDRPLPMGDGHTARYLTRKGEPPRLYVPPAMPAGWQEDPAVRLLVTEGEKKSLSGTQSGFPCLGIAGVWAWLVKGTSRSPRPLHDLDAIAWESRQVVVVGDSDLRQKKQAADGLRRLCGALASRGARAGLLLLPAGSGAKVGLDDLLVADGPAALAALLAKAAPGKGTSSWADLDGIIKPVQWVWDGWLAPGFLTMVAAGLQMGKSNLCLRIASCYLRGDPWPDDSPFAGPSAKVLWVETEAGQAMNLDRAKRWGLPLDRIITPFADPLVDVDLDSTDHRLALADAAARDDVGLSVVDSLSGRSARDEKSAAFGEVTGWLAGLARDTGKPVLLTHHLRKRGPRDPDPRREVTLEMIRGSTAILQATRTVWALDQPDPTSQWRRLHVIKNNLAKLSDSVGLAITDKGDVIFGPAPQPPHTDTAADRAADFLLGLLATGPVPTNTVFTEAEAAGIAKPTLNRAKSRLDLPP